MFGNCAAWHCHLCRCGPDAPATMPSAMASRAARLRTPQFSKDLFELVLDYIGTCGLGLSHGRCARPTMNQPSTYLKTSGMLPVRAAEQGRRRCSQARQPRPLCRRRQILQPDQQGQLIGTRNPRTGGNAGGCHRITEGPDEGIKGTTRPTSAKASERSD